MASLADTVAQAGSRLGLKSMPDKQLAYGVRDGYLVELACGRNGNSDCIVEIIRHGDPARDPAVREAIGRSAEVAAKGVKPKRVKVEDGLVVHRHPVMFFQRPGAEAVTGEVEALLRAVQTASAPAPARCRLCGSEQRRRARAPQRRGGSRVPRLRRAAEPRGPAGDRALRRGADESAPGRARGRPPRGGRRAGLGRHRHRHQPRLLAGGHRRGCPHRLGNGPGGGQGRAAHSGHRRALHPGLGAPRRALARGVPRPGAGAAHGASR